MRLQNCWFSLQMNCDTVHSYRWLVRPTGNSRGDSGFKILWPLFAIGKWRFIVLVGLWPALLSLRPALPATPLQICENLCGRRNAAGSDQCRAILDDRYRRFTDVEDTAQLRCTVLRCNLGSAQQLAVGTAKLKCPSKQQ